MAISNYLGIQSLLFKYSNNIRSQKSDQIPNRIPLFSTQLFEYLSNSNYLFKHCLMLDFILLRTCVYVIANEKF